MLNPVALPIITNTITEKRERAGSSTRGARSSG
jgi:hypothetical protein